MIFEILIRHFLKKERKVFVLKDKKIASFVKILKYIPDT